MFSLLNPSELNPSQMGMSVNTLIFIRNGRLNFAKVKKQPYPN